MWRCCTALPASRAATCQDTHAHMVRRQVGRQRRGIVNVRLGRLASASVRVACDERQVARVALLAMRHRRVCASTRTTTSDQGARADQRASRPDSEVHLD
eukprot:COSAG04_NODE_2205_length_4530_cov_1.886958_2_plen_100_part_00